MSKSKDVTRALDRLVLAEMAKESFFGGFWEAGPFAESYAEVPLLQGARRAAFAFAGWSEAALAKDKGP